MIRLNVFQANGTTAVGIVTNVLSVSYGQDVNSIGSWSASIPADSPQALYFGDRYRVQIYIEDEGYVFQGIVTKRQTRVSGETKVLEVSGWSTARELVDLDTGQGFELENDSLTDAFDAILAVEGTWTTDTIGSPALAVWSRRFDNVKLWQGLVKLADMFGVLFREDSRDRTIDAGAFGDDSGLTFKNWEGPVPVDLQDDNPNLVLLSGIDVAIETQDIITRVEPFGQRQGITGDKVTLEHATDTTLYTTQTSTRNSLDYYYLVDSTAETAYGRIEASIIVSDVLPLGLDPSTDLVRAANALHGVAATWLSRRKDPLRSYQLKVEGLRHIVSGSDTFLVGQKAKVIYQGASKSPDGTVVWLDLDEDLWIMGYRRSVGSDGKSSWNLRVSNVTRDVPDSTTKLAELYEQFDASLTAPWPTITWGGTPPVGRLTQDGMQLVVPTDSGIIGTEERKISWFDSTAFSSLRGHIFAAYNSGLATSYGRFAVNKATDGSMGLGIYDFANDRWHSELEINQHDGGFSPFLDYKGRVSGSLVSLLSLTNEGSDDWTLWVRKNGSLVKLGGGMKVAGAGYQIYPSAATGISPANAGSAWTNGSWSEVVASTAQADYLMGVIFGWDDLTNTTEVEAEIDIGTGAASSETVVSTLPAIKQATSSNGSTEATASADQRVVYFPHPIAVASTTRIAVRVRSSSTALEPTKIKLVYVEQADLVSL